VAGSILDALAEPYIIEGHVLHSSASIGVSICACGTPFV
jgi:hypothetical protein